MVNGCCRDLPFSLGTETPSVGKYLKPVIEEIKKSGLKYMACPMGTVVEGDIDSSYVKRCYEAIFEAGAKRVIISVKLMTEQINP